ncbi:hypothetical protein ACFL1R_12380, partial [Candidatus Latescibacterota bacterium]
MNPLSALKIISVKCIPVRLNFNMGVAHGLASRRYTKNVCVILESESGFFGYGECVPRSYVTNETTVSVLSSLDEMLEGIEYRSLFSPEDVLALIAEARNSDTGTANPAAMCAMELALFDLAGKHWNVSVLQLLKLEKKVSPLYYSLVVPL